MLSVLIPIYNFDVRAFVKDLSAQATAMDVPVEIICLDDLSDDAFRTSNAEIAALPTVRYETSEVNLGRSKVRNALVAMAQFEHLLILDCDGMVVKEDYLRSYHHLTDYDVVYGGRVYDEFRPTDPDLHFHWYCGSRREAIEVEDRLLTPYKSFMTNNFLIRKEVYEKVKMDESVEGYGHEDTLFAIELRKHGFTVEHIDNPIEHIGLESFEVFLKKSENAVRNLGLLMKAQKVDNSVTLVRYYKMLKRTGLIYPLLLFVRLFESKMLNSLRSANPNLLWFDVWKLRKLHGYASRS